MFRGFNMPSYVIELLYNERRHYMNKQKIKQFIEDHKEVVIGTVVGVGGAVLCTAAYHMGIKRGSYVECVGWVTMINADLDGTAMLAKKCLGDLVDNKEVIALGNNLLREVGN